MFQFATFSSENTAADIKNFYLQLYIILRNLENIITDYL